MDISHSAHIPELILDIAILGIPNGGGGGGGGDRMDRIRSGLRGGFRKIVFLV